MKTIIRPILALVICTQFLCCTTTTAPDGTVTKKVDHEALALGERVAIGLIDRNSGK